MHPSDPWARGTWTTSSERASVHCTFAATPSHALRCLSTLFPSSIFLRRAVVGDEGARTSPRMCHQAKARLSHAASIVELCRAAVGFCHVSSSGTRQRRQGQWPRWPQRRRRLRRRTYVALDQKYLEKITANTLKIGCLACELLYNLEART